MLFVEVTQVYILQKGLVCNAMLVTQIFCYQ